MKLRALLAISVFAAALPALAAPDCLGSGYLTVGPNCAFATNLAWAAAGLGSDSILTLYVPPRASGPVSFQFTALNSSLGSAYTGYLGILVGTPGQPGSFGVLTLSNLTTTVVIPGQVIQFLVTKVCFDSLCTAAPPAGAVPNMFSMQLLVLSPNPSDLDITPNPQLTIQFLNGNQVTVEEVGNARPTPGQNSSYIPGISLGATPEGRYIPNGTGGFTQPFDEFSVTNESTTGPITGSVTIQDVNAKPIVTVPIPAIPVGGAAGYLLIGRTPGDPLGLVSSDTALPVGPDGLFHGILVVTMTGPNVVTAQELYGNAFLNLQVFH
jgi:hypothetical protein